MLDLTILRPINHGHQTHRPRTNSEEVLVVVGYGAIGQNVAKIASALGMQVRIAERKGAASIRNGRVAFEQTLKEGTVFVLAAPVDMDTRNMFGQHEFEAMDPNSFILNVGRGGIINELELVKALRNCNIGGAATDVFEHEPPTKESSPLLDPTIPNLVLSPHIAWYSSKTIEGTLATAKANIEGFVAGKPQNIVIAGKGCS